MSNIIKQLIHHDIQYAIGRPEISDTEYDKLRTRAQDQFPDHEYFKTVGTKTKDRKTQLPYVLGSLNKVKTDSVVDWMRKKSDKIVISEKIDGVSIYVVYVDGKVEWASTRGDAFYGQDITEKAKRFCPKPKMEGVWMLRGEATLNIDPKILKYKTKRNGCAGILNRDGLKHNEHVVVYFYEVIEAPPEHDSQMETEINRLVLLDSLVGHENMPVFSMIGAINTGTETDILNILTEKYTKAKSRDYDVDGLVLTVNESVREDVEYPENKVAYKVNEEAVEATVVGIEWNTTRTGRIVPVLLIEPLEIQGVTVSRVTGHNFNYIYSNCIKTDTKIMIVRSGDVIPYITEVITEPDGFYEPCSRCPSCGEVPKIKGVDLVCENKNCEKQAYHKLEYWLRALGAEGISHITLEKIGVNTILGLYTIDEFDIMEHEGFGVRRANQVFDEIQRTLRTNGTSLLRAFGISGVARTASKALINHFGNIQAVLVARQSELEEVDGIGPITAGNIKYEQEKCLFLIRQLEEIGLTLTYEEKVESKMTGMIFSMTGKLPMKRDLLIKLIESNGGIWKNSVTMKTHFLVTNNPESTSGKMKKANKYGTRVINFNEFMGMVE
jgi:DNA ligase (NAD+)